MSSEKSNSNGRGNTCTGGEHASSSEEIHHGIDELVGLLSSFALASPAVSINAKFASRSHMMVFSVSLVRVNKKSVVDLESLFAEHVVLLVKLILDVIHGLVESFHSLVGVVARVQLGLQLLNLFLNLNFFIRR